MTVPWHGSGSRAGSLPLSTDGATPTVYLVGRIEPGGKDELLAEYGVYLLSFETKARISSSGSGKTIVEFFSLASSVSV